MKTIFTRRPIAYLGITIGCLCSLKFFCYADSFYLKEQNSQPSIRNEDEFTNKAQERYRIFTQQEKQMIENDQKMMQEGYDPNEGLQRPASHLDQTYFEQEQVLRGNTPYATPSSPRSKSKDNYKEEKNVPNSNSTTSWSD